MKTADEYFKESHPTIPVDDYGRSVLTYPQIFRLMEGYAHYKQNHEDILLTDKHIFQFTFKSKNDNKVTSEVSIKKFIDLVEEFAFESIPRMECHSSTCAINGFCECDDEYGDVELDKIILKK